MMDHTIPDTLRGLRAVRDVPGTPIRSGDILTRLRDWRPLSAVRIPFTVADIQQLNRVDIWRFTDRATMKRLQSVTDIPPARPPLEPLGGGAGDVWETIRDGRKWGRRRDGTYNVRLWIVRAVVPGTVSAPIRADSDEAAMFALLGDVGCRLPSAEASR